MIFYKLIIERIELTKNLIYILNHTNFYNLEYLSDCNMAHRCIYCGRIIPVATKEIFEGCATCGSKFFFYIRDEQLAKINENNIVAELNKVDKKKVEEEVRDILEVEDDEEPVILEFESVRVLEPGKFEIDLVGLINRKPIVFKLEEGKYLIDLDSAMPKKERAKKK